ncbi:unknown [Clostridium sp. CAG:354]|jgi:hypothetical protein|uniref:hypothetical protein n=1 Tax=Candidatus Merdicola sp. TaxID=3085652 RepID=UPI000335C7F5|nr:hypothetical protein [Clostridium sp.]MEE0268830.1 hypothetical protein [Clostridia bacterium]OKZ59977.1 MAG: hypothetical protein BHV96_04265 [Clostridium sp. CAG:354_28_25]CDE10576.1 unknown [Clostridium sp. CAG:354]
MNKIIKKVLSCCFIILLFVLSGQMVYADSVNQLEAQGAGQLVQIKENSEKKLEDYKEEYGSDAYGIAAYILNAVRIYSIPVCFVGIAIGGIYQVIGIRKLDERDRGFGIMIGCITVLVITQLLPLIFAIVVKGWRG